jgi:hypothetical protein
MPRSARNGRNVASALAKEQSVVTPSVNPDVVRAAKKARRYLIKIAKISRCPTDLAGMCGLSSFFTCAILNDFTLLRFGKFFHRTMEARGPLSQFCGVRMPCGGHQHYWTVKDGWIVDGTASQFGTKRYCNQPRYPAIFVSHQSEERYQESSTIDFLLEAKGFASRLLRSSAFYDFPCSTSRNNARTFYGLPKK